MHDITIPDAAVEAAARLSREENPIPRQKEWDAASPWIRQMWMDDVRPIIAAAAPYIAAQALRDMGEWFDRAAQLGTGERDVIAAQACYDRAGMIEADHG